MPAPQTIKDYDPDTTIVKGIVCKPCGKELPPMTMTEHLNGRGCPCQEKEDDETNGWEEVYNSSDWRNGTSRTYCDQPGTFYQTYGNGGGPGGWGGYWVRQGGRAVWEVAGSEFTYLEGSQLEVRPQDSYRGVCAAVRPVPRTLSQEDKEDNPTMCICCPHKTAFGTYGKNNDPLCEECKDEQEYCSCGIKLVDCEDCGPGDGFEDCAMGGEVVLLKTIH